MKVLRLGMAVLVLFVCHSTTRAQSATEPIIAKQRSRSYQIQPDGSKILKSEQLGTFYRTSSGASMNTMGWLATFSDEEGNTYELNLNTKVAKFVAHQEPLHELIKTKTLPESIKGYERVNGLDCAVQTTLLNGKPAGKSYVYLPYGLWVKVEHTNPPIDSILTVRELYDIEVREPDPSLVQIPEGYLIDNEPEQ